MHVLATTGGRRRCDVQYLLDGRRRCDVPAREHGFVRESEREILPIFHSAACHSSLLIKVLFRCEKILDFATLVKNIVQ